jgi:hypothetical protein
VKFIPLVILTLITSSCISDGDCRTTRRAEFVGEMQRNDTTFIQFRRVMTCYQEVK